MRSSYIIAAIIAAVALVWIGSGQISSKERTAPGTEVTTSEKQDAGPNARLPNVRVRHIRATSMQNRAIVNGRSEASRRTVLSAKIAGQIIATPVPRGARVKTNDVLVEIDTEDREANVKQAKELLHQRELEYGAAKKLVARGFDSEVRLAAAQAALEAARAALQKAELQLADTKIRAPYEAVFEERHVEIGDFVDKGTNVATVIDLNPVKMTAYVSEALVTKLVRGRKAEVELIDGTRLQGTISYIANTADEATRTFRVEISVSNPEMKLVEGMTVKLYLPLGEYKAHKISPSSLSLADDGSVGVKLVDDQNRVRFYPVRIIGDEPGAMWITGLPEEATLITVGHPFVVDGQEVMVTVSETEGLL